MKETTLDEFRALAQQGEVVPVCREIPGDMDTPVSVLERFIQDDCIALLESVEGGENLGRYSFLGYAPSMVITCKDGRMRVGDRTFETRRPDEAIREVLRAHRSPALDGFPPFTGGLVGYFAYDYIRYAEPALEGALAAGGESAFNDVDLMLFDKVIAFDNFRQKLVLIANVRLDGDVEAGYAAAQRDLAEMLELLSGDRPRARFPGRATSPFKARFTPEEYGEIVEKTKHYIREGDIFQAVPSNRQEADFEGSLFGTYRMLRTLNPSPYMFYFSGTDMEAAGASPETLVRLERGTLHTFPIAGSRPRGATPEEDAALERELLADPKECAEHNMLVDLGRNDLGRLAEPGSVQLKDFMEVQRYSHVMHLVSNIDAILRPEFDAFDLAAAAFPAGTLSGAPKIRAMEIINELEPEARGAYGGAVGYFSNTGNMDLAIVIRTLEIHKGVLTLQAGAGIVADSVPEKEYEETLNKGAAVMKALRQPVI